MKDRNEKYFNDIIKRLTKVYHKENFYETLSLFIKGLLIVSIWIYLLIQLEMLFNFNTEVRTGLFFVTLIILVLFILVLPLKPIVKNVFPLKYSVLNETALRTGRYFDDIKDELLNAIQLLEDESKNYSSDLINASFKSVYEKCRDLNFSGIVKASGIKKAIRLSLPIVFSLFLFIAYFDALNTSFYRLINYKTEYITPPRITFEVIPGNISLTRGDDLQVKARVYGEYESAVNIYTKTYNQSDFKSDRIIPVEKDVYSYKVNTVIADLQYFIECEGFESERFTVSVINRPFVKSLKAVITPPRYSELTQIVQLDNGSISALRGSRVSATIHASKKLSCAVMKLSDREVPLIINDKSASIEFFVKENESYSFSLTDEYDIGNRNPVEYDINIIPDYFPGIEIIKPDDKLRITTDQVTAVCKINDDFGFKKLNLNYRLSASRYETPGEEYSVVTVPIDHHNLEQEVYYVWDISELFLAEGDVVSYFFEVFDNDDVSGPKSTKSQTQTIMVPSMNEYFEEADKVQELAKQELTKTLDEAEKLQQEMEQLSNELKRDEKEITFEEKQKIENTLSKFEKLSKKAEDVAKKIKEMQNDLMQNNLLSDETMQKYMELQDLMKEMQGNELLDAMREMQQQLENLLRNQAQSNLENMKMNENAFKQSIERTLNLLKRLQVEQKLDELIKRAENIKDKSEEAAEKSENEDGNNNSLKKRSEDIKNELSEFGKSMENLKEKMNELNNMPMDKLEEIRENYEQQKNEELAEKLLNEAGQENKEFMEGAFRQMSGNMSKMSEMLNQMQQEMNSEMQMEMFYEMAKIINNLIHLSRDEEELKNKTQSTVASAGSEELKTLAERQISVSENLDKVIMSLTELAQKSFAVTPEIGKAIGSARMNMQSAQTYLQGRSSHSAVSKQRAAMKNINEAAMLLKGAMNQMMNSGGQGGGMMSLMQQLKEMGKQQMNLNQMTEMLSQERMAQRQMAEMQRLAREQEALRKSLSELNREARESGESSKLTSDLEKILDEMKEVVTEMSSNELSDQLLQKQERILSRLLDAQRSMNERDYEEKREAVSGNNIFTQSPDGLRFNSDEEVDRLKEELKKAMQQGYKKDYEELIRKYFEALEKQLKE